MTATLEWTPLAPFGAVVDYDLAHDMTPDVQAAFRSLLQERHLLVFPGQELSEEREREIVRPLGPVPEVVGFVSTDPTVGAQGHLELAFHSDLAFADEPDICVALHAVDVVDGASGTQFANTRTAYDRLPEELRTRIADLSAVHVWAIDQAGRNHVADLSDTDPRAVHPVVWTQPETGLPFLFVSEMLTCSIVGMDPDESEALLLELFGYLYTPDNILDHRWNRGDFVVWDNRILQHARQQLEPGQGTRTLQRVTVARHSYLELFPQFGLDENGYADNRHRPSET